MPRNVRLANALIYSTAAIVWGLAGSTLIAALFGTVAFLFVLSTVNR